MNTKKISVIVVSFILVFGLVAGIHLLQKSQSTVVKTDAAPLAVPQQVEITNVTHDSFTVSWMTRGSANGLISYGDTPETTFLARDKRDIFSQKLGKYTTHWVQVVGLKSKSSYFFSIQSEGTTYDNDGQLYQIMTGSELVEANDNANAYGEIISSDNQPADGALVYIVSEEMGILSTITDLQGRWSINLAQARAKNGSQIALITPDSKMEIRIFGSTANQTSLARIGGAQVSPAPLMQLGQTYDFLSLETSHTETTITTDYKSQFTFVPELGAQASSNLNDLTIWSPVDGETLSTTQPLFIGKAMINTSIQFSVSKTGMQSLSGTTMSDERGNWQWTPQQQLSSGAYQLSASMTGGQNETIQRTARFTIGTSNGTPAFESSSSAVQISISPTVTPSRTPTTTTEISQIPAEIPTLTPTPTRSAELTPTPTEALPQAGGVAPTVGLSIMGVIFVSAAAFLLL